MAGFGFLITLIDILLRTSRVHDILLPGLRVPLVVVILGVIALTASGRLFNFLFHPLGRWLAALTVLALLSVGVSVWPGGAYRHLMDVWIPGLPTFVFVSAFVRNYAQLRKLLLVTACGYGLVSYVVVLLSVDYGFQRGGVRGYTIGDPNELAIATLFGLPLIVMAVTRRNTPGLAKLFLVGSMFAAVPAFFRTGSRAGMITMVLLGLYVLYRQSAQVRMRLVLAAAIAVPAGLALTPASVIDRYATLITSFYGARDPIADPVREGEREVDEDATRSAAASASGRFDLLKKSLEVTLANPLLGVGPGMFMVAENEMAIADGRSRGSWKVSHNMYTQVSADLGIPALMIYLLILVRLWKTFGMAEKADPRLLSFAPELRKLGFALKLSLIAFMTGGLTLSYGYSFYVPFLSGVAVVIHHLLAVGYASAQPRPETPAEEAPAPAGRIPEPAIARQSFPSAGRA